MNDNPDRFRAPGGILSDTWDRQVDEFNSPPISDGGGSAGPFPFDAILEPDPVTMGNTLATFLPGVINGLLPSNYASSFSLSPSSTYFAIISCTASNGQITAASLSFGSSPPAAIPTNMGQPPLSFDFLLGIVITDGLGGATWSRIIGDGSLAAAGAEAFRTDKATPVPGTLPYDIWYTWNLTLS